MGPFLYHEDPFALISDLETEALELGVPGEPFVSQLNRAFMEFSFHGTRVLRLH